MLGVIFSRVGAMPRLKRMGGIFVARTRENSSQRLFLKCLWWGILRIT